MAWLIGIVIVLVVVYLMIVSPGFRYTALIVLALGGFGIWTLVENSNKQAEKARKAVYQQQLARFSAIKAAEIELANEAFGTRRKMGESTSFDYSVTVKNNSSRPVAYLIFRFKLLDCGPSNDCDTVGESRVAFGSNYEYTSNDIIVPAGQKRELTGAVSFKNLPSPQKATNLQFTRELEAVATP